MLNVLRQNIKKMKKFIALIVLGWSAHLFAQQTSLQTFNKLRVKSALQIELIQSDKNYLINPVDENNESLVKINENEGELILTYNNKCKIKITPVQLYFKNMDQIKSEDVSVVSSKDTLRFSVVNLKVSGASKVDLKLKSNLLEVDASGASSTKLSGYTDAAQMDVSGSASVKAPQLYTAKLKVNASGAAHVVAYSNGELNGEVSGAAALKVLGNPPVQNVNTSGAGYYNSNQTLFEQVNNNDTTAIKLGNTTFYVVNNDTLKAGFTKKKKLRKKHWAGIDLGINGFLNSAGSPNLSTNASINTNPQDITDFMEIQYEKSWMVGINLYEKYFKIKQHYFGLVTGLGMEFNNYELKHNVWLNPKGGYVINPNGSVFGQDYTWGEVDTMVTYSKNRFKTGYLTIPLLLELNTSDHPKKTFHANVGLLTGLKITGKMKYEYDLNGKHEKHKDKDSFNTNPVKLALTARVGVGRFTVFANYQLNRLFQKGEGPEVYPFAVGIQLVHF